MKKTENLLKQVSTYLMYDTIYDQNNSGTVYKAKHKETKEPCLIKVLTKERLKNDVYFSERIQQEGKFFQELDNPSILRFFNVVETANYYYFICEGSDEGTLEGFIKENNKIFSEDEVLALLIMIIESYFDFFKRQRPYNNLSSKSLYKFGYHYKLSPFFLPVYYESLENSLKNFKPSPYISPEGLEGAPNTAKRDIWALGVLTYELFFGKIPFNGDNIISLSKNIEKNLSDVNKSIEKSNKISPDLKNLMKRMLEIESKRINWPELVEHNILRNYKKNLENILVRDYQKVCEDLQNGKVSFIPNQGMKAIKMLPSIDTTKNSISDSPILQRNIREVLECFDNEYSFKARLLTTLETVYLNWSTLLHASPKKAFSPKKKGSPTKKGKSNNKIIDDEDFELEFDEGINVMLPKDSSIEKRNSMLSNTDSKKKSEEKKMNNGSEEKEEKKKNNKSNSVGELGKNKLRRSNSSSSDEGKNKDTLKIMKPSVYPQIELHNKETEKARMNYLKSLRLKKETLKPILEVSVEESSTLDTLTISVVKRNFQDVVKEFFYRYLHEKEIIEFLYNTYLQMDKLNTDCNKSFPGYCLMKLIMLRFSLLKANIEGKMNVFSLDFWKEIVNLEMYNDIKKNCVEEDQKRYEGSYKKSYNEAKNYSSLLNSEQKKFINYDLNTPHFEMNKNFNESFHLLIIELYEEGKNVKKKDSKKFVEIFTIIYKLMFCLEVSKYLSFVKLDLEIDFDIVEFQERMISIKPENLIYEVDLYKNKLIEVKKK